MNKEHGQKILDIVSEMNPEALFPTGMEECLVGYVERIGLEIQVLLDRNRCIDFLIGQGMTEEEAIEYFEYNVLGACVGEHTPFFATII